MHFTHSSILFVASLFAAACGGQPAGAAQDTVVVPGGGDSALVVLPIEARDLVLRGREHEREDRRDSARAAYLDASTMLPQISDWLLLRAAGVIVDSAERAGLYSRLQMAVARDRIGWTEALARERAGDIEGAVREFAKVGARISVFRLRLARAREPAARDAIRREVLEYLQSGPSLDLERDALAFFDQSFPERSAREQLVLARSAARVGRAARAVEGFDAAFRAGLGTPRDRFSYAAMLARSGRQADAAAQYARVREPASLAAAAQYQRARMQIASGNVGSARSILRQVASEWPSDTSAASALLLLADLATDENRDAAARDAFLAIPRRFPEGRHSGVALFRAALIAYIRGDYRTAAAEFAQSAQRYPRGDEATAARYWTGRALAAAGDRARAEATWTDLMGREPSSYYTVLAARRLGVELPLGAPGDTAAVVVPEVDSALVRVGLLDALEMRVEARHEYDRLIADAGDSRDRLTATAEALSGTEQATRAIALGWSLVNDVGRSPRVYRIVYPVVERERIVQESRANGLDPVLVASLIRQESNFNPRATSPAGARGLMQIMPAVGQQLAARRGLAGYTADSLYDPAVNVTLGTMHLRNLLSAHPNVERALAAYNAGDSRVRRWVTKAGAQDVEVFTERIPFVETRGYVRAIVRNRAFYQELYSW